MTPSEGRAVVALFAKPHADAPAVLRRTVACLQRHGAEILPDDAAAEALGRSDSFDRVDAAARATLVISVGGDGTLLASARAVGVRGTPILGVNLGNLGFLTETRTEDVDRVIDLALTGKAPLERRHALVVQREVLSKPNAELALNDVVVTQSLQRLFSVSLYVDDEWVADYRADGLIIATPTGSTAYSLSAGGPVMVPSVDALIVTPISPHSLSQRPLVLAGTARVMLAVAEGERHNGVRIAFDGQHFYPIDPGEKLSITRSPHPIVLVRPPGRTFFATLRDKLGWGH